MCIDCYSFCIWGKIKAKKYDIQSVLGCLQQKNHIFFIERHTLEFQIKGEGRINGEGAINREVGKKSPKLIHGELGINEEVGKFWPK